MSKQTRQHRPTPNKDVRVQLTPREFRDFHGICAIAATRVFAIQQVAQQRLAECQVPRQEAFARLLKKYRAAGLRADLEYAFDEQTHSLVSVGHGEK